MSIDDVPMMQCFVCLRWIPHDEKYVSLNYHIEHVGTDYASEHVGTDYAVYVDQAESLLTACMGCAPPREELAKPFMHYPGAPLD